MKATSSCVLRNNLPLFQAPERPKSNAVQQDAALHCCPDTPECETTSQPATSAVKIPLGQVAPGPGVEMMLRVAVLNVIIDRMLTRGPKSRRVGELIGVPAEDRPKKLIQAIKYGKGTAEQLNMVLLHLMSSD